MAFLGIPPPEFDLGWWQAALAGVAATASLIAAAAALRALLYFRGQARSASTAVGMDCLWKLIERWDSDVMRRRRVRAANALSKKPRPEFTQDVIDIANEFEHVGYLVFEAKAVGATDAWGLFSSWAGPYWYASEPHFTEQGAGDPTLWERYKQLVDEFDSIERKRRVIPASMPLPYLSELEEFLNDEKLLRLEEDEAEAIKGYPGPGSPTWAEAPLRAFWYRLRSAIS